MGRGRFTVRRSAFSRKLGLEPAKRQSMERTKAAMAQSRGKMARKRILAVWGG